MAIITALPKTSCLESAFDILEALLFSSYFSGIPVLSAEDDFRSTCLAHPGL
jgi:hypothetical protein